MKNVVWGSSVNLYFCTLEPDQREIMLCSNIKYKRWLWLIHISIHIKRRTKKWLNFWFRTQYALRSEHHQEQALRFLCAADFFPIFVFDVNRCCRSFRAKKFLGNAKNYLKKINSEKDIWICLVLTSRLICKCCKFHPDGANSISSQITSSEPFLGYTRLSFKCNRYLDLHRPTIRMLCMSCSM